MVFIAAVDAATMPQQKMSKPSHVGAPTFVMMRLLGTWNIRYPREKMPAAAAFYNRPATCLTMMGLQAYALMHMPVELPESMRPVTRQPKSGCGS